MTNDQAYRALLLEWFDKTSQHPMMGMASLSAPRMQELKHLIETCRPATESDPAQDVVLAKLAWSRPQKPSDRPPVSLISCYAAETALFAIQATNPTGMIPLKSDDDILGDDEPLRPSSR